MEFDRAHLHAGQKALGRIEIQIGLFVPILLRYRNVAHGIAEAAGVVLLKKTLLGTSLRAAHQADGA